jgi:predicted GNAT family N-acyltransferase
MTQVSPTEVEALSLRSAGLSSLFSAEAKAWISSLTPEQDNEHGPNFWRWMVDNLQSGGQPVFDTFFLRYKPTKELIATASLVFDDRDVGKQYNIPGIWLGGLNVRREYRRAAGRYQNVGRLMIEHALHHVQKCADHDQAIIPLNCFTTSLTRRVLEKYGFKQYGHFYVKHFGLTADFYRREFIPVLSTRA